MKLRTLNRLLTTPTITLIVLLAPLLSAQAPPTTDTDTNAKKIAAYLSAHHALNQFSGAALVADQGKLVYRGAFGLANEEWQIPNTVDTKFRLASLTKQFTAMLVLLLVEDGVLELEAPLLRYLPDYPARAGNRVTIHHLLNHTSGIPNYTNRRGFMRNEAGSRLPVAEFIAKYCSDPLEFEPGSQMRYSNSGYYLLGAVVEAVTGGTYAKALQERILDPLKMQNTGFDEYRTVLDKRASGYEQLLGKRQGARWIEMSNAYAAGALYSTVEDMWKWSQALQSKRLLQGRLEKRMLQPGRGTFGYGWTINLRDPDHPVQLHTGGINGFSTIIVRGPSRGQTIVLLSNQSGAATHEAARGINAILRGEIPTVSARRPDRTLAHTALEQGVPAALHLLDQSPTTYRTTEIERAVNQLGYQLLEHKRTTEALQLLEFNAQAFPKVANVWDSLGEAHLMSGNRELARENYQKALALDPSSKTAAAMLKKLADSVEADATPPAVPTVDSYFVGTNEIESITGPDCITRSILQDKQGNLWFSTWHGIVRYDGQSFVNLTNQQGLARFRAFSSLEDRSGALWFGTVGVGLYRYDGNAFTHFTTADGLANNLVICILQDSAGNLWFGTKGGLSRFDGQTFRNFTTSEGLSHDEITTIAEDEAGVLWIGTRGAACKYDGQKFTTLAPQPGATLTNVRSIVVAHDGIVWIGGQDGLWSNQRGAFTKHLSNFTGAVYQDKNKLLWLALSDLKNTYEMSLYRYDGTVPAGIGDPLPKPVAQPRGQVFGLEEDSEGNLWFGTERGPMYYDGKTVRRAVKASPQMGGSGGIDTGGK